MLKHSQHPPLLLIMGPLTNCPMQIAVMKPGEINPVYPIQT